MADIYNIDGIIAEALRYGYDISPTDRQEWSMFCCALKTLGFDQATFEALSWQDSKTQKLCSVVWKSERHPQRYRTEDQAKGMIVTLAKNAGMDVKPFLMSQDGESRKRKKCRPAFRPTASPRPEKPTAPPADFIPFEFVVAAESRSSETSLFSFMKNEFGESAARFIFGAYHIGASKYIAPNGYRAASLPYIDVDQRVVDCKIMHFDPVTGSRKTASPIFPNTPITWAIKSMNWERKRKGEPELNRADWCNFGDHLLKERPGADVSIVESEKTAIIAALTYPERIWIAVGSFNNLTSERLEPYRGRKITIFPDRDGIITWRAKAESFAANGHDVRIDTTITRYPGGPKDDLADILLRWRHGTQAAPEPQQRNDVAECDTTCKAMDEVLKDFLKWNPALAELIDKLDCEPIRVEPYREQNQTNV